MLHVIKYITIGINVSSGTLYSVITCMCGSENEKFLSHKSKNWREKFSLSWEGGGGGRIFISIRV